MEPQLPDGPRVGLEEPRIPVKPERSLKELGTIVICTWLFISCSITYSDALNSNSGLHFSDKTFLTWCSNMFISSQSCEMGVYLVVSDSNLHWSSLLSSFTEWHFFIWTYFLNSVIGWCATTDTLLGPSWMGSATSRTWTLVANLVSSLEIFGYFLACSRLFHRLGLIMSCQMCFVALTWLTHWSDRSLQWSSWAFIPSVT